MKKFRVKNVDSFEDSEVGVYAHLTNNQLRNRLDPAHSVMICESPFVVEVALQTGQVPHSFLTDTAHILQASEILERCGWRRCTQDQNAIPLFVMPPQELERLVGYKITRGLLAAMERPQGASITKTLGKAHTIAVLENLVDVSNVGAVFRNAAALNVDAVLLAPHCADHLSRRAIRVSMGTVFQVTWACVPEELWVEGLVRMLHEEGFITTALALTDAAVPLTDIKRTSSLEKHALFFGSEGYGLDQRTIEACDQTAIIPMSHAVDSLNVAASSAVAFWELFARSKR